QELHNYYERKRKSDPKSLAPEGFELIKISFIIVLTQDGRLAGLQDVREEEGQSNKGVKMLLPASVKRASAIKPNLLWDNLEYTLGIPRSSIEKAEEEIKKRCKENEEVFNIQKAYREFASSLIPDVANPKHKAFVAEIKSWELSYDPGVCAVLEFLNSTALKGISQEQNWPEALRAKGNLSFQLQGDLELICQRTEVRLAIESKLAQGTGNGNFCLVQGHADSLAEIHPSIKGVRGGQPTGGNIVSFNAPAFCSQGKEQGANATVGRSAAFTYTTALNHLLRSGSTQRLQVGDASTVFWAADDTAMEDAFGNAFADDPDCNVDEVRGALTSLYRGSLSLKEGSIRFFVLGLAPNAARISVRFWHTGTVAELAERLDSYFEDLQIVHAPQENGFLPLGKLLRNTAVQYKSDNINSRMAGELMHAILSGTPYPRSVLNAVIGRIRADQSVSFPRAALLKAWLNRQRRFYSTSDQEMLMALDPDNTNPGYRLGRLFAVLEKAQEEAIPGANAGIRDRYYGAASSTPVSVFPILLKNYPHHIGKLQVGRKTNLEKLVQSITLELQAFPKVLKLEDQGRFALGYYHQRQDLFTKKEKEPSSGGTESAAPIQPELV
ncbi:MAG: type I-C CRISPR-associated protein Cas8c/Csd1, partial [SAR324 cluster bacterium]|nr:type I-C CRISPR-associated protein Cas8c/Csd1 [SAR324 cluster bacterium]